VALTATNAKPGRKDIRPPAKGRFSIVKYSTTKAALLLVSVLLALIVLPFGAAAASVTAVGAPAATTVTGTLAFGQSEVITFGYDGRNQEADFNLTYSPPAASTDPSIVDGLVASLFLPNSPSGAKPIGQATTDQKNHPGFRLLTLRSFTGGTYSIVLTNVDASHRTVNFTLTSGFSNPSSDIQVPGPTMTVASISK